jgi:hypothetical protein
MRRRLISCRHEMQSGQIECTKSRTAPMASGCFWAVGTWLAPSMTANVDPTTASCTALAWETGTMGSALPHNTSTGILISWIQWRT